MGNSTFILLKKIIEGSETQLSTQTIINEYLKDVNTLEAYTLIEELKNQGYIEILPITGLTGPVTNIRPFYESIRNYDFMQDIKTMNVVRVTIKGYDYYKEINSEKWRFGIPLIISIISLVISGSSLLKDWFV